MRALTLIPLIAAPALLAACASPMQTADGRGDLDRLERRCAERGGVLVPNPRGVTGYPAVDNLCRINDPTQTMTPTPRS